MPYAHGTQVRVENSRAEVERILRKADATKMGFMYDGGNAVVGFELNGIAVKLEVRVLSVDDFHKKNDKNSPRAWWSKNAAARREYCREQQEVELRRKWRVLILLLKAKLEAIADGDTTVEREFLYDLVTQGGRTVGELLRKDLDAILTGENRPQFLLGSGAP